MPPSKGKGTESKNKGRKVKVVEQPEDSGEDFAFSDPKGSEVGIVVTQTKSQATGRTKAHDIAEFFVKIMNEQGELEKRVCRICRDLYGDEVTKNVPNFKYGPRTSSPNLRHHLYTHHDAEYKKKCLEMGWDFRPKIKETSGQLRKNGLPDFAPETFLEYLVRFVTADDQAIRVVDCPEFRDVCMLLRPDLDDKQIPRRQKLREGVLSQFKVEFSKLKEELSQSCGRISLTTDVWSNKQRASFLAVTTHWLSYQNDKLTLKAALIGFHRMTGKHSGKAIAQSILEVIERAEITHKLGHITMDNATNNDAAMVELERLLAKKKIPFDAQDRRIRCYPHIINICVSHIVKSIATFSGVPKADQADQDAEDDSAWETDNEDEMGYDGEGSDGDDDLEIIGPLEHDWELQSWLVAVKKNPINKARKIVRTVRSSGQRRDAFQQTIIEGNRMKSFEDEAGDNVQVNNLQLIADVKHRWDSLYQMLYRMKELQPAVDKYLIDYHTNLQLVKDEWDVIDGLRVVLQAPHEVQQAMSAHTTPVLSGAIPSFELFMTQWETLGKRHKTLKIWTDVGLKWARKYYTRMDDTHAYVIAMFLNPCIRFAWFEKEWDSHFIKSAEEIILKAMRRYDGTQERKAVPQVPASPVKAAVKLPSKYQLPGSSSLFARPQVRTKVEDMYEAYKGGQRSPLGTDLLQYWQNHRDEYPPLYAMAMDYLPIQASSVPCEHVFSSAAETDTKKRNRLSPIIMEALQILKFIYKKDRLNFTAGLTTSEKKPIVQNWDARLADLLIKDEDEEVDKLLRACSLGDSDEE